MLVDILNRQVSMGVDVTLLIINNIYDSQLIATIDPRVKVIRMDRHPGSSKMALFLKLNFQVRKLHPQVIHIHDANVAAALRGVDNRMVYTVHAMSLSQKKLRKGIRQIAISEAVRDAILKLNPDAAIVGVVLNGIDVDTIKCRPLNKGLDDNHISLIQVGRLDCELKGQDLLIEALSIVEKRGYNNVYLDFIGEGDDFDKLKMLVEEYGLTSKVSFRGKKSRRELYGMYAEYDIMVHPARNEGFGLIIAEAMSAGLPVIVPKGGGPYEVVGQGAYGTVYTPNEPDRIADAIIEVIGNYSRALEIANRGKKVATDFYSLQSTVDAYFKIYRSIQSANW